MTLRERVSTVWRRFYDWKTEHHFLGRYSVDKLQQFSRYQARVGIGRCLAVVCVLSMLLVFMLIVGLGAIPVNSPGLGIEHNAGALLRSAIAHSVGTGMWGFYMMKYLEILQHSRSFKTFGVLCVTAGCLPEGLWIALGTAWKYPVPGSEAFSMMISLAFIVFSSRCLQMKESNATHRRRARTYTTVVTGYVLIIVFFLLIAWGFAQAPWGIQLTLILIHPPLRSLLKRQYWVYARKLDDLSSDVTLSIVDMSAAVYQTLCIQYASNPQLEILIIIEELLLGLGVAHMYLMHAFIVDGCQTLSTAIKIVEGSLSSTHVIEEEEVQLEEPNKESNDTNETLVTQQIEESTRIQAVVLPSSSQTLSDATMTYSQRSILESASFNGRESEASKCLPVETSKQSRNSPLCSDLIDGQGSRTLHLRPKTAQRLSHASSSDFPKRTAPVKPQHLHSWMINAAGGSVKKTEGTEFWAHDSRTSPQGAQQLRRTISDAIPESKCERGKLTRKLSFRYGSRQSEPNTSVSRPRPQSWSRGPSKVCCFTDLQPELASPLQSPKQKNQLQERSSSRDLPPLGDLQTRDGSGYHRPVHRPTSVFLTPRTILKHGSKRLLDLSRITGPDVVNTYSSNGVLPQQDHSAQARRSSQVSIDGMFIVRKDQARILEQTLQLLFSCEVLIVAEFIKVLVPLLQGLLLVTLWHLPSAQYNVLLHDVSKERIVERMLWCLGFAVLGLPPLVMVCIVVFKKYGISPLHLLAFLLEQQYANFQTKLASCFLTLIFSTSVHQGITSLAP